MFNKKSKRNLIKYIKSILLIVGIVTIIFLLSKEGKSKRRPINLYNELPICKKDGTIVSKINSITDTVAKIN